MPATLAAAPETAHCAYDFAQVDVFAENPLEGNALAIFTDARGLSTEEMQALARETNLSETTFILPRDPRDRTRTRSPGTHLPTVARNSPSPVIPRSAPQAGSTGTIQSCVARRQITLDLGVGPIPVRFTPSQACEHGVFGTMKQNDPVFGEIRDSTEDRAALAAALNLSGRRPRSRSSRTDRLNRHVCSASCRCDRWRSRTSCESLRR